MNQCPQCGQMRKMEEYRCQKCGCFFSQLDEYLASEAAKKERASLKGRFKAIWQSSNRKQAFYAEWSDLKQNTPNSVLFTWFVIFVFVFALIVSVI